MALTNINRGTTANDGTGNTLREGAIIINANNAILQDLLDNAARVDTVNTFQLDQTFNGSISVEQSSVFEDSVSILGNLYVQGTGSEIITETINSESDYITMRYNNPVALGGSEYSGFEINNYDGTNSMYLNVGLDGIWRMGEIGSFVAIAGREDAPTNGGYAIWNDTTSIFDTKSAAQTAIDLNYWVLGTGTDLGYTGNVDVNGTVTATGLLVESSVSNEGLSINTIGSSGNTSSVIKYKESANGLFGASLAYEGGDDSLGLSIPSNTFAIVTHNNSLTGGVALSIKRNERYVGINKDDPQSELDVDGTVTATVFSQSGVPILRGSQSSLPASTIDFQSANNLTKTLTEALTLDFSNIVTDTAITLTLTTGATLYAVNLVQSGVTFGGYNGSVLSGVVQGLGINSTYDISFLALSATQIRVSVNQVTF